MEKLPVAKITKPQGIGGDVKLIMLAHDFDLMGKQLFVGEKPAKAEKVYVVGGAVAVKFDIICDRMDAENYRNMLVEVKKEDIVVPPDHYLVGDMLEKVAVLKSGTELGKIIDVSNYGSADIITIKGKQEIMCSYKQGLIEKIEGQKIVLDDKVFAEVAVYED